MKKYIPILILIGICLLFFYKTLLFGKIPFPGDLLLTQYAPWRHQSYGGYVAGAVPSKDQYFDVIRELYPWKTQVISQLKSGKVPLWNPYNFSGSPLLANYQSQVFYPFTVLYFLLPQITAWTIMVILQPVLGSVFLYFFATEIGLSSAAAIFSALLFNFSGFSNVWMEFTTVWHTILWLPLLLYLIERGVKQNKLYIWQQALFIFGLFSAITAGHPQDFINSFLLLLVYTFLRARHLAKWPLLFIFIIPFFLAAPQLFPTVELFRNSARVAHDYQGIIQHMLVQWWQVPLVAVQELFGNPATKSTMTGDYVGKTLSVGIVGLFFAVEALFAKHRSWHKTFFAAAGIAILLVTVRTPLSELLYRYPWPVLSTGTPTRNLFILALSLSMLAGFGYDAVRQTRQFPSKTFITIGVVLFVLWLFVFIHPSISGLTYTLTAVSTMKRAMIIATGLFAGLSLIILVSRYKNILLWMSIPLAAAELFYGFIKFNPFVPALFVYPQNKLITYLQKNTGIDRFWGYGTAGVEANFATQEYIYSPDGTDPLNLRWYNQFIQSSREGNIAVTFNRTTRSDAQILPGYGQKDLPSNEFRLRIMDALGVKYIIDRSENPKDDTTFPVDRFKTVWHEDDWTVYENVKAAPRFFLTSDVRYYNTTRDFEVQFFSGTFIPDHTVLLQNKDAINTVFRSHPADTVTLGKYTPNDIVFLVNSANPQLLFLNDTYDQGWKATVNTDPVTLYKANYAFRAIAVPAGSSRITLTYKPLSFTAGVYVGIAAWMGCLAAGIYTVWKRKKIK